MRRFLSTLIGFVVAAVTMATIVVLPQPGEAAAQVNQALVVNSTDDRPDVSGADGVCRTSTNTCSLRAAISQANYNRGADTITFAIPGNGTKTINTSSTLTFNDPSGGTTVDGYTQAGASVNTAVQGSNAVIRVEIRSVQILEPIILVESAENTLRGLAVYGPGTRLEFRNEGADGNRLIGSFIGTNAAGTATSAGQGISLVLGPDRNQIGAAGAENRNVLSGNSGWGIRLNHGETSENVIENNVIGLKPDLSGRLTQAAGIDVQWWTWGNYIADNVVSGNSYAGIDVSHSATGNTFVGNFIGTLADGNTATSYSYNGTGFLVKDNPVGNYIGRNVMGNSNKDGIWHKHNYTGANTFVDNRVGVGVDGGDVGNDQFGLELTGHDDLYVGNIFANNGDGGVYVHNDSVVDNHTNFPQEKTLGNLVRQSVFYRNGSGPHIDIEEEGRNNNDNGDNDDGAHLKLNFPTLTGIAPGEIYGQACANCTIEVYQSGAFQSDGTLNVTSSNRGIGASWIGRTTANAAGAFSMADNRMVAGKNLYFVAIDTAGNTSETSPNTRVPSTANGVIGGNPSPNLGSVAVPAEPSRPPAYQRDQFQCTFSNGTLSWEDDGAPEYYVWAISNGAETYLGPVNGTSIAAPPADSYRVQHWNDGFATESECQGDGAQGPFSCSYADGTLSWDDAGASEYFVFATTGGVERYLGSQTGQAMAVAGAESYRVEHWLAGATEAECQGDGADPAFSCSHGAGVLTWDDAGATEYYVFAISNGVETYLGGHSATSLTVPGADSYRVEHWASGSATNANCGGDGIGNGSFTCTYDAGVLTWDDAGAAEYYVFGINGGAETYLGGHGTTSLSTGAADSYRVEHWLSGAATNAECPGPGGAGPFSCSYDAGVLSWDDAGADEYYVFAVNGGVETYLGGHTTTSLSTDPAEGYRVEHWLSGQATNASCAPA